MMYEIYKENRVEYPNRIIIIKSGSFYVVINEDAFILKQICNYQIRKQGYGYKIGFPIIALCKVLNRLEIKKINYIVIEGGNITDKMKFSNNNYNIYSNFQLKYEIIIEKLKMIESQLFKCNEEFFDSILIAIGKLV